MKRLERMFEIVGHAKEIDRKRQRHVKNVQQCATIPPPVCQMFDMYNMFEMWYNFKGCARDACGGVRVSTMLYTVSDFFTKMRHLSNI